MYVRGVYFKLIVPVDYPKSVFPDELLSLPHFLRKWGYFVLIGFSPSK